jgi:hypothetical protein
MHTPVTGGRPGVSTSRFWPRLRSWFHRRPNLAAESQATFKMDSHPLTDEDRAWLHRPDVERIDRSKLGPVPPGVR